MGNCNPYTKLIRIKPIKKTFQEVSSLLKLGIRKLSTVIYIHTATLLLSVHATQLQQAEGEDNIASIF